MLPVYNEISKKMFWECGLSAGNIHPHSFIRLSMHYFCPRLMQHVYSDAYIMYSYFSRSTFHCDGYQGYKHILTIMTSVLCMLNLFTYLSPSELLLLATFITVFTPCHQCQFVYQYIFNWMNSNSESNRRAYLRIIMAIQAHSAGLRMSQQVASAVLVEPSSCTCASYLRD